MEKPISTERSRPHQMSQSAMGSPTQYKSFAATVRSAIRSPSREWTNTIKAVTSPTLKKDSSATVSKTSEKEPQKPTNKKDYGFKEQVEIVKKTLPLEQVKATADSYASPRPSKTTTQDNTPDNKSSTSKGSTPKLARLGSSNPYMLYQFVTDQAMSQSMPNMNDKVASLTKEVEDSVKVIAEKEKEIEQLKLSIKENLEKMQRQDKDLAQIKETSSNVEKSLKETCDKLNIKLVQCEQEISDLKVKIEKLNEEHKKIIDQMKGDEAVKISEWKDKAVELEKRVKILEGEILVSGEAAKGLQEKEKEIVHLKGQLDAQEKEMKRVKEDNLKLEEQLKRFDSQLGDMIRKSEDKLKLQISQLKETIKSLEEEIKHYKDLNAKLEQPAREPDVSKDVLEEKEAKIHSLESEIKRLVTDKESSIKNSHQISEALVLINNFGRNLQIPNQSELIPALHLLLEEFTKSQQCSKEKISAENESHNQMITMQEHNAIKNEFENKIELLQSEKHELSEKLEEAEALASLVKIQQQHQLLISNTNLVSESREVSLCPEEEYKEEQEVTVTEYASEAGEEKLNSSRQLTKKKVINSKTKLGKEDLTLSVKKKSSTKASKLDSHKEVKKMREDDPIYKQLEKMIKDLTERVVTSDKKAKKAYEEKLVEVSNAQFAKEQLLLEEMEKLKEEKKELLKKLDDMQWDKAYEYMRKTKAEKQVEVKAVEQASKPKKTVLETGKNKKKK